MKTLGDRPAFPRNGIPSPDEGMSLRQWLAGEALAGICASTGVYIKGSERHDALIAHIAEAAVAIADATLKELAKEGR